ncbi:histone H2A [Gregarina niphandrodes]|uniref:Histone H2A n=1 Tax=Gregarina niphandrodes TaxID=110365 RepID=A0A023BBN7_GRENI|nr:histone H2A [Gregarina niphandrodes]EZG80164.1 histone H2A [Gregarina niphandrodes]|eukprot:XP_011134321.1 histone H2A [Gregarina niphandrodes]
MASPSGTQNTPVVRNSEKNVGRGKSKGGKRSSAGKSQSKSERAGLVFPVGRTARLIREGNYAPRVGVGAPIYLAAVLEYLTAELLEIAGAVAKDLKKNRIVPRHLALAIRGDEELSQLLGHVTIAAGGVPPQVNEALLPKKSGKKGASQEE